MTTGDPGAGDPDAKIETVFVAGDANQQAIAESLLTEAGIPFESRNDVLQNVVGFGRLGGTNPLVGPVKILVPGEYADEARRLLEPNTFYYDPDQHELDTPPELEPPAEPADPRLVKLRRLALSSLIVPIFLPAPYGSALGVALALWALGLPHEEDETINRWRVIAVFAALAGLVGIWLGVTATSYS